MRKVYYLPVASSGHIDEISTGAKKLFQHFIHEENIALAPYAPLKVHFGEKKQSNLFNIAKLHMRLRPNKVNRWCI